MISLITSLYKSDSYLNNFSIALKKFSASLKKVNQNFELIAIANDPTKRETEFANEFKSEPWFHYISVPREPLYTTWNRGITMAKGTMLGFWNTDDVRYPEALIEASMLFSQGTELVYFPFKVKRYTQIYNKSILIYTKTINKSIPSYTTSNKLEFERSMVYGPFFMFTKELYNRVGPYDEQFKIVGDFDWCIRAAKITNKIQKASTLAGEFRVDGHGLSAGATERFTVENNVVLKRHGVLEKIIETPSPLIHEYVVDTIQYGSKKYPVIKP